MKNLCFLFAICLLLASCTPDTPKTKEPKLEAPKHIVIIGVDGMSPNGIINAPTPNMAPMALFHHQRVISKK